MRAFVRRLMVLAGLFAWGLLEVIALGLVGIAVGSLAAALLDGKPVSDVPQYMAGQLFFVLYLSLLFIGGCGPPLLVIAMVVGGVLALTRLLVLWMDAINRQG